MALGTPLLPVQCKGYPHEYLSGRLKLELYGSQHFTSERLKSILLSVQFFFNFLLLNITWPLVNWRLFRMLEIKYQIRFKHLPFYLGICSCFLSPGTSLNLTLGGKNSSPKPHIIIFFTFICSYVLRGMLSLRCEVRGWSMKMYIPLESA